MTGIRDTLDGATATAPTAADAAAAEPGASLGRFTVVGPLGRGGMGVVVSAFDPRLSRKVAIKLMSPELGEHAGPLLEREAQALASLAHPNVVAVYEIGHVDDRLFIAMELVDGTTLRAWLAQARRGWREIVAMFVAAGRGLVAAHAAGLTHRDFKPDNVLIGRDGRPRVSDFGIATRRLERALEPAAIADLDASSAADGVPIGTPAYMAPEQWTGGATDARTDQFAFAVALWSALFGERPFAGDTAASLREAVVAGRDRRPAHPGRAPRWVVPLLVRALAVDPDQRWPALAELLDQLERRTAARRRTGVVLAVGLAIAGIAVAIAARPASEPCAPPDARIAQVWGTARRAAIALHTAAVDPAYGVQRFVAAAGTLDPELAAWRAMHVAACRATRVDGTQSDHLLDLRMRCLGDWLAASSRVAAGLAAATSSIDVEAAVHGVSAIPRLERCADLRTLVAPIDPPGRPADRLESDAILVEVQAIEAALQRSELAGLGARADGVVARARRLAHPYTLSRALGSRARTAVADRDVALAVGLLREQIAVAAGARDDEEVARAWASLLRLVALYQGRPADAKAMFLAADSAAARTGDQPDLVADLLHGEGVVLVEAGEYEAALAKLAEARRVLVAAGASDPGSPLVRYLAALTQTTGDARYAMGELDAAAASMREALAIYTRIYGPDTVEAGSLQVDLAQVLRERGQLDDAERAARAAVRIRERGGQTPSLAMAESVLTDLLSRRGRNAEAIALGERMIALARATMPPSDATLTVMIEILADAYDAGGQLPRALALYDETLATFAREGVSNVNVLSGLVNRASIARRLGQCATALAGFRDAAERASRLQGETAHSVGIALRGEGLCLDQLGRGREAIAVLERGLGFLAPGVQADEAQLARGVLGRLLIVTGRDPARGEALVQSALARLHEIQSTDPVTVGLDAWIAARRGRSGDRATVR